MEDATGQHQHSHDVRLTIRGQLFDDVFYGRMTPDEAEAEADRQGLEPLCNNPEPALFDAMAEPSWTLAMTVAWIVWRTPEAVRDNWDAYRCQCWDWFWGQWRLPVDGGRTWDVASGWELRQRGHATLSLLSMQEAYSDSMEGECQKLLSVKEAREQLWKRLVEDALTATAIRADTKVPDKVPAHEWPYLTAAADESGADELRYEHTPLRAVYSKVTFRRTDAVRLWPAPVAFIDEDTAEVKSEALVSAPGPQKTRIKRGRERVKLAARVLWPDGIPPMTNDRRNEAINEWLQSKKLPPVSAPTISKALNE